MKERLRSDFIGATTNMPKIEQKSTLNDSKTREGGGMSEARVFIVARSRGKGYVTLAFKPRITPDELELEGARFGQWLLENSSTSFLKGLHHLFDEAEITKKIGLGY
jgi:hypothetical protein